MSSTEKQPTKCGVCGGKAVASRARLEYSVNGEAVWVPGIPHQRCKEEDCGEATLTPKAAQRYLEKGRGIYRELHILLDPEEIRELRESRGLSQVALAELLGLGMNTVSRWETGRKVQSTSMDRFLRLLKDVPEAEAYLRRQVA